VTRLEFLSENYGIVNTLMPIAINLRLLSIEIVSQPEPSMTWSAIADRAAEFMFLKEILRGDNNETLFHVYFKCQALF
jgi:hypothetical protein